MNAIMVGNLFFFALLGTASGFFLWMIGPYLLPVFWAVVIAVIFYPLYERVLTFVNDRATIASLLTIGAVMVIVILPLLFIGGIVVNESVALYQTVTSDDADITFATTLTNQADLVFEYLEPLGIAPEEIRGRLTDSVEQITQVISSSLVRYTQFTLEFLVKIAITFYLLFFLFKYGAYLRNSVTRFVPLKQTHEKQLIKRFVETTQAVVQGNLSIAFLQGLIGALTLWIAGVTAPALWGMVMAVFAIIPALGASFVLFPAAIILIISGSVWTGVFVIVIAVLVVGIVDDVLRPVLVGRKAKIPDAIVLLATVGGIATFGISGFVLGPIIATFCLALWVIFADEYKNILQQ